MPATKRGIYHNLKESTIALSNTEIILYFSSELYQTQFINRYKKNRKAYRVAFAADYLNSDTLSDIMLYMDVEKRGFRILMKGFEITCREAHEYALRRMTKENTPDWYVMRAPKSGVLKQIMK